MDNDDPITQFFPDADSVDLYDVLGLTSSTTADAIKKAYRRLALAHHPDKHATADEDARAAAALRFQQVGFAYAVLSDEKRRSRYDATGSTAEAMGLDVGEDGWDAYFEQMFEKVTKGKLDDMKKQYQGSDEEVTDVKAAYETSGGSIEEIMRYIPFSTIEDEPRVIVLVDSLITDGTLPKLPAWTAGVADEKARLVRRKQATKEAAEAEALARELGVWDEFYGSGKEGTRVGRGKGQSRNASKSQTGPKKKGANADDDDDEGDTSALQALILKKKKNMDGFFDGLAAKYAEPPKVSKGKGKKRAQAHDEDDGSTSPKKKSRGAPPPPDIDDEEFAKLQSRLFGDQVKPSEDTVRTKTNRVAKGKKAK